VVVFDTGALIALERNQRDVVVLVAEARRSNTTITVPAGCVAQTWRDPRRQARVAGFLRLPNVNVVALDDAEARRVGLLLAAAGATDIVDAHVALCALRGPQVVLTSDPQDIRRLAPQIATQDV
jgi:hypothetical protein